MSDHRGGYAGSGDKPPKVPRNLKTSTNPPKKGQTEQLLARRIEFLREQADHVERAGAHAPWVAQVFREDAEELARLAQRVEAQQKAIEMAGLLVAGIPCQQMMALEDCDTAVAQHMKHPERYEPVPRSEWCERCKAVAILSDAALASHPAPQPEAKSDA